MKKGQVKRKFDGREVEGELELKQKGGKERDKTHLKGEEKFKVDKHF